MSLHSYGSIFNPGHKAFDPLFAVPCTVQEKVDGCLVPEARVLTADLRYVSAGLLKPGDKLIACDDSVNPKLRETVVTVARPIKKSCTQLTFNDRTVTCSNDHPWLVRGKANNPKQWKLTSELELGDELVALPLWEPEQSQASGYLAGMYDGEGSLVRHVNGRVVTFYQKVGPELTRVVELLKQRGFEVSVSIRRRKKHHQRVGCVRILGGWSEALRLLGTVRPERLVRKAKQKMWNRSPTNGLLAPKLLAKKGVGIRTVIGLSTKCHTYIGEGMLCHNSQFSFGVPAEGDYAGTLQCRSKGAVMAAEAPEKMFTLAVRTARNLFEQGLLVPGYTYRCEFLQKPKHNALMYERVPNGNIILFDVDKGGFDMMPPLELAAEGERLGLEVVPLLHVGQVDFDLLRRLVDQSKPILGGPMVEGVVVKQLPPVTIWTTDKKPLMGKLVAEKFKEIHKLTWGEENPNQGQIIERIALAISSPARWQKAVMRLKEAGVYTGTVKDIGPLVKSVQGDLEKECREEAAKLLMEHFWNDIRRSASRGIPQWYKSELLRESLNATPEGD